MEIKWNKHVVVLYDKESDTGVAEALRYYLEREFAPCDVVTVDNVSYTNYWVNKITMSVHRFGVKHARRLLKFASQKREKHNLQRIREENKTKRAQEGVNDKKHTAEITRMLNIIKRFDPVVMICTTPYALHMAIRAKRLLGRDVNVVGAVTDFALDPAFVQPGADGYFVENPEVRLRLIRFGVDEERIAVIGMPSVAKRDDKSTEEKRRALGITNDLPVVVVDGGIYDTETLKEDVVQLMRNKRDYNLVIVTASGKMRRYYMDLPEFAAGVVINDKMNESVLDVASVLVTMPNSKTIFGAFMRGVSVVVAQSVTTLEHEIRRYLVKRALVIPTRTPMETLFAVDELLQEPERRQEFQLRGAMYARRSLRDIGNITPKLEAGETLKINNGSVTDTDGANE